jgi:3-oxoadipate enol-lactonase
VPIVGVAGTKLHYERAGSGEPLLMIQGMSGTHLAWGQPFAAPLRERFDCVSFDNRGIGLSSPVTDPFTIAEMAADTVGLLDELEIESAHVLGISMGGMIAQELVLAHPERVRTLTLGCTYCGGPGSRLTDPADSRALVEALGSGDRERAIRAMWELNLSPGFRAEASRFGDFEAMATALPVGRETVGLQVQAIFAHDTSARLGEISAPTLIVHGDLDRVIPIDNGHLIAALMPGARLEVLADTGHMFWWERPDRSAELIAAHALGA